MPLKAPQGFIKHIVKGTIKDPLLFQILPLAIEDKSQNRFACDPLSEIESQVVPEVLQKYQGRMLSVTMGACAIHCRYCFRRHFSYSEVSLSDEDPLVLSDQKLA